MLAGLAYAAYTVIAKQQLDAGRPPSAVMAAAFGLGGLLSIPILVIQRWTESMDWLGARTQNEADLRRYLTYEQYKSVLVDVVRYTQSVAEGRTPADDAARTLSRKILRLAALLDRPAPKQRELESMLAEWAGRS